MERRRPTLTSMFIAAAIALTLRYWATSSARTQAIAKRAGDQMTANYGLEPTPPPPDADRTIEQARAEFVADIRRLNQYHPIVGWSFDTETQSFILICGCDNRPRTVGSKTHHWAEAVRKERGPKKVR